ncbi:MAG TPA: AAA family ATPase [Candidatus Saccharimonadales bacterium]|nr:AAA family ATPase [Candidatus Saccharimonadales bacterium]
MTSLVLQLDTRKQVEAFLSSPSHALLLTGPAGVGKTALARHIAASLLQIPGPKLQSYPYFQVIKTVDNKAVGIDAIRALDHFLLLKISSAKPLARLALIEDAHTMTVEAQNALLKLLEEPPANTVIVLSAAHEQSLLPTIRSRVQKISVKRPNVAELTGFFNQAGFSSAKIAQALAMSGSLPGLTYALLNEDQTHPMVEAAGLARQLLQFSAYERLLVADKLTKDRGMSLDLCYILGQMAHMALRKAAGNSAERWRGILTASYKATEQLLANAQPKLTLTNLLLNL